MAIVNRRNWMSRKLNTGWTIKRTGNSLRVIWLKDTLLAGIDAACQMTSSLKDQFNRQPMHQTAVLPQKILHF
jgi:hypothetical protein